MSFCVVNWTKKTYGPYQDEADARERGLRHIADSDEYSIVELPPQAGAGRPIERGRGASSDRHGSVRWGADMSIE